MLAVTVDEVRKSVRSLEDSERRSALHMFNIGIAGYDPEEDSFELSVAKFRAEYAREGYSATGKTSVERYRSAAPHAARIGRDDAERRDLMHAFYTLTMPGNSVSGKGLKKAELAEYAADVEVYVAEGESVKKALALTRDQWSAQPETAPQAGEGRPNDGTRDDDAAGDPGAMSRGEALTAAVRLLKVAAKDITPTEAALYENLITEAFDLVGDLFATVNK